MQANKILFRCSSLGYIMTESRTKSEPLSETCKNHLVDVFISYRYNRRQDIQTRYTIKGTMVEEDSMTLYSRYKRKMYRKNQERFSNDYIAGTPDIVVVDGAAPELIIDIKSSWDIFTFMRNKHKDLNKQYYWQMQGYMALTGAKSAVLAYCLSNTPDQLIEGQKRTLWYQMGQPPQDSDLWLDAEAEINRMAIYDDIDISERIIEINIERNDSDIEALYKKIGICRAWMQKELFSTPEPNQQVELFNQSLDGLKTNQ